MKKRFHLQSIRFKVLLFGMMMSTIPLLLISTYYLYETMKEVESRSSKQQQLIAEGFANDIFNEIDETYQRLKMVSSIEKVEEQKGIFYTLLKEQDSIDDVVLLNGEGHPLLRVSRYELNQWDPQERWPNDMNLITAAYENDWVFSEVDFNEFGQPYLQLITRNGHSHEEEHFLGISIQLQKVIGDLASYQFEEGALLFLLDEQERIIAHKDYSQLWQQDDRSAVEREEYIQVRIPIEKVHWELVIEQPRSEMLAPVYEMIRRGVFTVVLVILVVSLISIFAGLNFVRPIEMLQSGMRKLKYGYFPKEMEVTRKDEFGELTVAFNEMSKEIKEKSDRILQEKERLDIVVNSMEAGLAIVKSDYTVSWMNPTLEKWIGKERQLPCFKLFNDETSPCYSCPLNESHHLEKLDDMIMKKDDGGETRIFRHRLYPLKHTADGEREALVVMEDITEEKKMEEKLIQTDKLSALGLMASSFAHEVNNPLASVQVYAEDLSDRIIEEKEDFIQSGEMEEYLQIMRKNIDRCKEITTNLLNFSRKSQWSSEKIDVKKVVKESLALVRHTLKKHHVSLSINVNETLPELEGDSLKLSQVFVNLIQNAIDAMESEEERKLQIGATFNKNENQIEVVFKDSGTGIDEADLSKLFDPFYTSKPVGKGTGLGLSVCYGIIEQFGGRIDVDSVKGEGTTFTVILPYKNEEDEKGEDK
ncbi:HAMP domain-containing protein [Bacillus shivajii]|uniref:ATP-binding protein n=1 Tax=Bacillus shivajii TaxID=1983719 RepID=UPI001CF99D9C|nr:ATP-binding protein [Bacillus shivajii]UCZ52464.1 HAMP domain-containing protein [Bacillus shivajii]